MKQYITAFFSLSIFFLFGSPVLAFCDAIVTGWQDTGSMVQMGCLDKAKSGLNQTGARNVNQNNATIFARIGSARVAIRCVTERRLVYIVVTGCDLPTLNLIAREIANYYK